MELAKETEEPPLSSDLQNGKHVYDICTCMDMQACITIILTFT